MDKLYCIVYFITYFSPKHSSSWPTDYCITFMKCTFVTENILLYLLPYCSPRLSIHLQARIRTVWKLYVIILCTADKIWKKCFKSITNISYRFRLYFKYLMEQNAGHCIYRTRTLYFMLATKIICTHLFIENNKQIRILRWQIE